MHPLFGRRRIWANQVLRSIGLGRCCSSNCGLYTFRQPSNNVLRKLSVTSFWEPRPRHAFQCPIPMIKGHDSTHSSKLEHRGGPNPTVRRMRHSASSLCVHSCPEKSDASEISTSRGGFRPPTSDPDHLSRM